MPGKQMQASLKALVAHPQSPKWSVATEGLDGDQKEGLLNRMRPVSISPRELLFAQDEPSDTLILLTDGRVRLFQSSANGEEFTFGVYLPGTLLGLAALVVEQPRILSAEAIDPVLALVMTRPNFLWCIEAYPQFHWNVTRLLAILSLDSIARSAPMALEAAAVRLGMILRSLARPDPGDATGKRHVIDGHTHEDLAKMIGVSRTWIGVTLAEFEKSGVISKRRGRITIGSVSRLEKLIRTGRQPGW